jgi:hypothetical protein
MPCFKTIYATAEMLTLTRVSPRTNQFIVLLRISISRPDAALGVGDKFWPATAAVRPEEFRRRQRLVYNPAALNVSQAWTLPV